MGVVFAMATMYNKTMKGAGKVLICSVVCVGLAATGLAATIDAPANEAATNTDANPYGAIVLRNVFGLSDAVVPPVTNKEPDPPPNVMLIGLSTLETVPQAIVVVKPPQIPGHPPPAEETYIMNQGERRGPLELVRINMKAGTAKIKIDAVESTISMRTNAPVHAAAPPVQGGVPRPPAYPLPAAGYTPPTQPGPANGNNGGIPDRPMRTDQPPPSLSPEEQTLMIEAQRQDAIQRNDPIATIYPPTDMSPPEYQPHDDAQPNPGSAPGLVLPTTEPTPGNPIRLPTRR